MAGTYIFGADIGGTTVKCGLFTVTGELLEKWELPTNLAENGSKIPADVAQSVREKIEERGLAAAEIVGLGVGVPGPITEDGVVLKCVNLKWDVFNVKSLLAQLTGLKTAVANDANVAALGEMWQGAAAGRKNVVMVTLGTGVGGGIIVNGSVIAGSNGAGGEIGHIIVNPEETECCGCGGHGHLEQYASATGVVRLARLYMPQRELKSAKDVFDLAKAGDAMALRVVDRYGYYLGFALSHVAAVVDPEVFVIGGGMARAGQIVVEVVEKYYNNNLLHALKKKEFVLAKLGNDAGIYGCAQLILTKHCLDDET